MKLCAYIVSFPCSHQQLVPGQCISCCVVLSLPWMCSQNQCYCHLASRNAKHCIAPMSLDDSEFTVATTNALLHQTFTLLPCQFLPQTTVAITAGRSSVARLSPCHMSWKQSELQKAAWPLDSEAMEMILPKHPGKEPGIDFVPLAGLIPCPGLPESF